MQHVWLSFRKREEERRMPRRAAFALRVPEQGPEKGRRGERGEGGEHENDGRVNREPHTSSEAPRSPDPYGVAGRGRRLTGPFAPPRLAWVNIKDARRNGRHCGRANECAQIACHV